MGKIKEKLEKIINTDSVNLVPGCLYLGEGVFATVMSVFTGIEAYKSFERVGPSHVIDWGALSVAAGIIGVCSYVNSIKYLKKK